MQVQVVAEGGFDSAQALAYAEYRVFVALARYDAHVQAARIALRYEGEEGPTAFRCRLTVTLAPTGSVRTRVSASHPYAAIDRAAARIGHLVQCRAKPLGSS